MTRALPAHDSCLATYDRNLNPGAQPLKPRYSHLLFDLDNTLVDYHRAEAWALEQACGSLGVAWHEDVLKEYCTLNNAIWREFERGEIGPAELRVERMRRLSAALSIRFDPVRFSKAYLEYLSRTPFVVDGALRVVDMLRRACRICLLSNGFTSIQHPRIERTGLKLRADAIVISEEIGHAKPDTAIFDHASALLGHPAKSSMLMIGDNLSSDIQGGLNYGIDTCWYTPSAILSEEGPQPTHTIARLPELPAIVGVL